MAAPLHHMESRVESVVRPCTRAHDPQRPFYAVFQGLRYTSDGCELARLCIEEKCRTFHLETWDQFEPSMIADAKIAGVTAGASTPESVISAFVQNLEAL